MVCAAMVFMLGCSQDITPSEDPKPAIQTDVSETQTTDAETGSAAKAPLEESLEETVEVTSDNAEAVLEELIKEIDADTE